MKNIHVLPTDKPSRLSKNKEGLHIFEKGISYKAVNIYITTSEEIKEGDWVYDKILNSVFKFESGEANDDYIVKNIKKIILTTDQNLIKDGVQDIDDEFLEWFVKNPSCEYIKTEKWLDDEGEVLYSRIIPKEEPKQETLEEAFEKFMNQNFSGQLTLGFVLGAMKFGAKWQQEQDKNKYSEEEVLKLLLNSEEYTSRFNGRTDLKHWFEQFKKK